MLQPALEPAAAEAWLLHVVAQEADYSWFWRLASPPPAPALVWPLAGYAGSVGLTVGIFGEASVQWLKQGRISNQFWAAAWRALHLMRVALRQCHTLSEAETPVKQRSGRATMLRLLVTRYSQILRLLLDMAVNDAETNQELSIWARAGRNKTPMAALRAEYPDRCVVVLDALAAHGYGPAATQRLGELVSAWPL